MQIPYEPPLTAVVLGDLTDAPESRDIALNEDQVGFLDAVREGNESRVRVYVFVEKLIDVNCANLIGETALQIAANNNHRDIAKFLVEHGADVVSALLQAVAKESVDWVKALLDFVELSNQQNSATSSHTKSFLGFSKKPYRSYISPLMLAAQNDCPELVQLFLEKGYVIKEPQMHKKSFTGEECESLLGNRIGRSIYRLHSYRALASPIYLCISYLLDDSTEEQNIKSSKDPMVRAFLLNRKFESLVETEYEFKSDYKRLSNQCEEFAVSLLQKCQSIEEISCIMSVPGIEQLEHVEVRGGKEAQKLSVLNFAIANKNEKFVAHPYSQLMLNSKLYNDLESWKDLNFVIKILVGFFFASLLPLWFLIYFFAPNSHLSQLLKKPFFKFLNHGGSFVWFLALLICSSIQDKFFNVLEFSPLDLFLTVWIIGMLVQEAKEAYRQGTERYQSQYWNLVKIFMLFLFVASGVFWLIGYFMNVVGQNSWKIPIETVFSDKNATESAYRFVLLSNVFFSLAMVLAFFHASNFFQVSSVLGPLQLSLVTMTADIGKFLFLFLLLFLSFGFAQRKVYSRYVQAREAFAGNKTDHEFARIGGTLRYLFWNVFGMTELGDLNTSEEFVITQYAGEVLLALYAIASLLVAINMLIAMMSNTYQRVADDADIQWKFSRTRMWMPYLDEGNVMPPPFNLIPPPRVVINFCQRLLSHGCHRQRSGSTPTREEMTTDRKKRRRMMKLLIQRYLVSFAKTGDKTSASQQPTEREETAM
ncbi:LOW QUALITY PROTEIN: short transient receptor potential channel 4-like [Acropora millepora]|uniref:LOW QUALITY PROTEIN: short transient receptor potential channel 4-like n=1 Tax=Acropora millepora TaxID=45264 RepID=UPI001CF417FD|nr:LOW QUALITY PROTEIN: short transient receptor potential channel 4-like [Acropora millepora]